MGDSFVPGLSYRSGAHELWALIVESFREWYRVLSGRKAFRLTETPYVPSRFAVEES